MQFLAELLTGGNLFFSPKISCCDIRWRDSNLIIHLVQAGVKANMGQKTPFQYSKVGCSVGVTGTHMGQYCLLSEIGNGKD